MKKNFIIILVLLFLAIFISGCIGILTTPGEDILESGDDSMAPEMGKGKLKIYLTNSLGDYKANDSENYSAINVTVSKIEAHLVGESEEAEGEWIEWELAEPAEYNLIELKDVFVLLSEGELASGKYTQIRLFVTEASVIIEVELEVEEKSNSEIDKEIDVEPTPIDVEIPSGYQTGIKLIHPFEIIEGETTELTIDFDAEKSIIKTGNEKYELKMVPASIIGMLNKMR